MMKTATSILGALFCLTAIIGFFSPAFMGMVLTPLHDVILLLTGVIALYFGGNGTEFECRRVCQVIGVVFTLLGVATLMSSAGTATPEGLEIQSKHVLKLLPGSLEYTGADGVRNLIFGIMALVAGFLPREQEIAIDMTAQKIRQKAGHH
jgi:uncharacterized membrane protein